MKFKNNISAILFAILLLCFSVPVFAQNNHSQSAESSVPNAVTISPAKFVVSPSETQDEIVQSLLDQNYIKDANAFNAIFSKKKWDILPGAYKLTLNMTLAQVSKILHSKPYMKWIVIPPGLRKEEIADLLATNLGWTKSQKTKWINVYTKTKPEYIEGVYFPDTYLIPVAETPSATASRLIAMFNENFAPYLLQFNQQDITWTKGLTLASIVQREAANVSDMPLIAGILQNRLNEGIPLEVDATVQYARGNKGLGWWAPITPADLKIVSPFNTYKNVGLPPHPISNPSLDAIAAVLNPAKTDCLYYLHDKEGITHCAATYAEHEANIAKYLK